MIWPLLLLSTLGIIQAGVWVHGRNVAQRSATAAVDVARGTYGTVAEAGDVAADLAESGGLTGVRVEVHRDSTQVEVVVSAESPGFLDLGLGRLRERASSPRERVTPP
ncbi:MAG: hypothetical protein JWP61_2087 [Friedmanniella sp.]|nr:hypothetical protein [Friedmanniella sp.]